MPTARKLEVESVREIINAQKNVVDMVDSTCNWASTNVHDCMGNGYTLYRLVPRPLYLSFGESCVHVSMTFTP